MKERVAFAGLWLSSVAFASALEVKCAWRFGSISGGMLPGVAWWLLATARMREFRWSAMLLVPLSGLAWPGTGLSGTGAFGMALSAALVPERLLERGLWQPAAGSIFLAVVFNLCAWCIEALGGNWVRQPGIEELLGWLFSGFLSGALAFLLLLGGDLLGTSAPKHLSTLLPLDTAGFKDRVGKAEVGEMV